jgi:hypothetical protein
LACLSACISSTQMILVRSIVCFCLSLFNVGFFLGLTELIAKVWAA